MKESKILVSGLLIGALIAGGLMFFFMQKRSLQHAEQLHLEYQSQHAQLIDSVRQNGLVKFMSTLFEKIENELAQNPDRTLSDGTISQIAALSEGFKPYAIVHGGRLSEAPLSPERGHLLLLLLGTEIDSGSWSRILSNVTFANADLKGADLRDAMLQGAKLTNANLTDANLTGTNLYTSDLRFTNLSGADLSQIDLRKCDLTLADLSWADMKHADLTEAILNGAQLTSANMRYTQLNKAVAQRVIMHDAFLNYAIMDDADFLEASLDRVHFEQTSLRHANLVLTTFAETNLSAADLDSTIVLNDKWFSNMKLWNITDSTEVQNNYEIRPVDNNPNSRFPLLIKNR
jgi:uncharacterized protein YjbI with pentapeptide repeats